MFSPLFCSGLSLTIQPFSLLFLVNKVVLVPSLHSNSPRIWHPCKDCGLFAFVSYTASVLLTLSAPQVSLSTSTFIESTEPLGRRWRVISIISTSLLWSTLPLGAPTNKSGYSALQNRRHLPLPSPRQGGKQPLNVAAVVYDCMFVSISAWVTRYGFTC